jgi:hypothetical protein
MNLFRRVLLCAALTCLVAPEAQAQFDIQARKASPHPVCFEKADAYKLASADRQGNAQTLWNEFVAEGRCATVPATYLFTLDIYMAEELSRIVEYSASGKRMWGLVTKLPSNIWQIRYDPEWENSPPHVRQWFQDLRQPDQPQLSCCGEADSYEADLYEQDGESYIAIITGQGPAVDKPVIPAGTRLTVPNSKIKWDKGNPTGHGIIFVGGNFKVICYVPPAGI